MKPFYKWSNKSNRFHLKMESNEETAAAIVVSLLVKRNRKQRNRKKRNRKKTKTSAWLKPWLGRRINLSLYEVLAQELRR